MQDIQKLWKVFGSRRPNMTERMHTIDKRQTEALRGMESRLIK